MADYISKNKFKQQNTDEALYADILKSLKNSKDVNLQGMDGFQYKPVNKKASIGDSIKEGWKAFKDYSRENQWVQPTLQGAAGAGIGALTGLLMGPKRRALKVLLSTLGGAGIGVGTGFATNYALKKEKQKADNQQQQAVYEKFQKQQQPQLQKNRQQEHNWRIKQEQERVKNQAQKKRRQDLAKVDQFITKNLTDDDKWGANIGEEVREAHMERIGIRPSDRLLYQFAFKPYSRRLEALDSMRLNKGRHPQEIRTIQLDLKRQLNDVKTKLNGKDMLYNLAHLDTSEDKAWRSKRILEALSPQRQSAILYNKLPWYTKALYLKDKSLEARPPWEYDGSKLRQEY